MARSRHLRRIVVLLLTVAVLCLLMGWFPQAPLKRFVESRLRKTLGADVSLGALQVVPLRLSFALRGLHIKGEGFEIQAKGGRLALSWSEVVRFRMQRLSLLSIEEPYVSLTILSDKKAPAPGVGKPLSLLAIGRLTVKEGTLVITWKGTDRRLALEGVNVDGGVGEGSLVASVAKSSWAAPNPIELGRFRGDVRWTGGSSLRIETLEAQRNHSRIEVKGEARLSPELEGRLDYVVRVDLEEAEALWRSLDTEARANDRSASQAPVGLRGVVAASGRAELAPQGASIKGQLRSDALGVGSLAFQSLEGTFEHKDSTQVGLSLKGLGGETQMRLFLRGNRTEAEVTLNRLDLARLAGSLGSGGSALKGTMSGHVRAEGDRSRALSLVASVEVDGAYGANIMKLGAEANGSFGAKGDIDVSWSAAGMSESPPASTSLQVQGSARGQWPPEVSGVLSGSTTTRSAAGPVEWSHEGTLAYGGTEGRLDLKSAGGKGTLQAHAESRGRRWQARIDGKELELGMFSPQLKSKASLNVEAMGSGSAYTVSGEATGREVAWDGTELGDVHLSLDATQDLARLGVEVPALGVSSDGTVGMKRGARLQGTASLEKTPLQRLSKLSPSVRELSGSVSGALAFDVPLESPKEGRVEADLSEVSIETSDLSLRSEKPFHLEADKDRLSIQDLSVVGPGINASVSGTIGLVDPLPLDLQTEMRLELKDLLHKRPEWDVGGSAEVDASLKGTPSHPDIQGFAQIAEASAVVPRLDVVRCPELGLAFDGDSIKILPADLQVAGSVIRLDGSVPLASFLARARQNAGRLSPAEEASVSLQWESLGLARLGALLNPESAVAMEGALAGDLEVEGGFLALSELRGGLALEASSLKLGEVPVTIAPVQLTLESGRLRADAVQAETEGGTLTVQGTVDLGSKEMNLTSQGSLDLRALSPWLEDTALAGKASMDVELKGRVDAPDPRGHLLLTDATARMREIPQALTDIQANVVFEGRAFHIENMSALLGGGRVTVTGAGDLGTSEASEVAMDIQGQDIALEYPSGLRSRIDADLSLGGRWGGLFLQGGIKAFSGHYSLDIVLEESLRAVPETAIESPLLRSIGLDVRVETVSPVRVINNQAELEVGGALSLRGNLEGPVPFGRLEIREGGKIFWQGREFRTRSGSLTYEGSWNPSLSLIADASIPWEEGAAKIQDVKVTVEAKGPLYGPSLSFQSQPYHSQLEILNLITTGEIRKDVSVSTGGWVVGEQAASLLAGHLSRKATRSFQGLGLDEVQIQPELLARETDPGARFIFGKRIDDRTKLIYSSSLQNAEERFVQLSFTPGRQVLATAQRREDGTFSYGLGQRGSWWGPKREKTREGKLRVKEVVVEGGIPFSEAQLKAWLKVKPGKRISSWDLQDRAQDLRDRLRKDGYLEAEVSVRLEESEGRALFRVYAGAGYRWQVVGMPASPGLDKVLRPALFEEEAVERGRARLLEVLHKRGHFRAKVKVEIRREELQKTLLFNVEPGPKLQIAAVDFPGASALSASQLLKAGGGLAQFLADPLRARAGIQQAYRKRHFLTARVDPVEVHETAEAVRLRVPITEGRQATFRSLHFELLTSDAEAGSGGAGAVQDEGAAEARTPNDAADLEKIANLRLGQPYDAGALAEAIRRLRDHYFEKGCLEARLSPKVVPSEGDYDVVVTIVEGTCFVLGSVKVEGLTRTNESLVRRAIRLKPGVPLDPRELARVEQRLLALGVFSRTEASLSKENPTTLTLAVQEDARAFGGYALRYYDDRGFDVQFDAELRNLLGYGLALGGTYRYSSEIEERRGSLHLPSLPAFGDLTISFSRLGETLPQDNHRVTYELGAQETKKLPHRWDLLFGYRYRRVRLVTQDIGEFVNDLSGVDLSLVRETRDSPFSPRKGAFLSASVSYSPRFLGGDLTFVKGFVQASLARTIRPSWVWAQGYRVGLAHGFGGQQLDCLERFSAGGANSLRGFATNSLGPFDVFCETRGNALVVVNQELRYAHQSGLGGVVFYDAGNVFGEISTIRWRLRHSLGAGLRWNSPVGLLRLDVGFPLDRQSGEKSLHYFFSLGQAF